LKTMAVSCDCGRSWSAVPSWSFGYLSRKRREPMTESGLRLLLVDDDERFNERLARALRDRGAVVTTARTAEAALELAREAGVGAVVTDLRMPGKDGLQLVAELHRLRPQLQIVVLTGYGSIATAVEAMKLGASGYLVKP